MKHRFKSRTHRFNALTGALLVAESQAHLLKPLLGDATYGVFAFILVIGNHILREMTTGPVGGKREVEQHVAD